MVKKYLISDRFSFSYRFFSHDVLIIPYELFHGSFSELNGTKKIFLHRYLLKLCLKKKRKINEFFPDTTVFTIKKLAMRTNDIKR